MSGREYLEAIKEQLDLGRHQHRMGENILGAFGYVRRRATALAEINATLQDIGLAGCGKTLLSTQGRKLSDDKRRPIACSERIIRIGLSHAECRRDS